MRFVSDAKITELASAIKNGKRDFVFTFIDDEQLTYFRLGTFEERLVLHRDWIRLFLEAGDEIGSRQFEDKYGSILFPADEIDLDAQLREMDETEEARQKHEATANKMFTEQHAAFQKWHAEQKGFFNFFKRLYKTFF